MGNLGMMEFGWLEIPTLTKRNLSKVLVLSACGNYEGRVRLLSEQLEGSPLRHEYSFDTYILSGVFCGIEVRPRFLLGFRAKKEKGDWKLVIPFQISECFFIRDFFGKSNTHFNSSHTLKGNRFVVETIYFEEVDQIIHMGATDRTEKIRLWGI